MSSSLLFYYFGDDEAYFRTLISEFKKHTRTAIDFQRLYETDEQSVQSLFLRVYRDQPAAVFIDLSKNTQEYLHLARLITRTKMQHSLVTVGLVDYLSPPSIRIESIATGTTFTHIKSPESYDVVYDVMKLAAPSDIASHGFAVASPKDEWEVGIPMKVGYVTSKGLHVECNMKIDKGDRIKINHAWTDKRIVPSKEIFVQGSSNRNLFYQFNYGADLRFLFVDEFFPPEGMTDDRVAEKKRERVELIAHHKKQLLKWIADNADRSHEKKVKVLVVDSEFHFYDQQERTDKHPFHLRCIPYFEDIPTELERIEPQVIAFSMDKEGVATPKNNNETLIQLIEGMKEKLGDVSPFLIIFNCPRSSKEMQLTFNYPQIISTSGDLSVEAVMKMAGVFEKKLSEYLADATEGKMPSRVYLEKNNPASIAEIIIPITVMKISESDLVFQCQTPLKPGTNLHLSAPFDLYINVQPLKAQGKVPEYIGLIHSIGEEQKKELRKYINAIFFREHDAQRSSETDEFKKLNERKESERAAEELARRAAMEAEKSKKK